MKLLDPTVVVPDIEVQIDTGIDEPTENIVKHWGVRFPVVSINNKALPIATVTNYRLYISNGIPSFRMTIIDADYSIRNSLSDETFDTCVVFIGEQKWYRKYQGIITDSYSSINSDTINISGILFNEKFYDSIQESFMKLTIKDVIVKLCTDMGMGLFLFEDGNTDLSKSFSAINPGKRRLEYLLSYIENNTDNIYCIDDNYFLHIGNVDSMRQQEVDTYTIKNGRFFDEPKPIVLTNKIFSEGVTIEESTELVYNGYSLNTDRGSAQIKYSSEYYLNNEKLKIKDNGIGYGSSTDNIFKPFEDRYNPFIIERKNRDKHGKEITLEMKDNLLEITPFLIVDLKIYDFNDVDEEGNPKLDEKHSGKKIIISYDESYDLDSDEDNKYIQKITVI